MSGTDSVYSPDQERGLAAILDTLIPPSSDGHLPGAGELGLARVLAQRAPVLAPLVVQALAILDGLAAERGAADFAGLDARERPALLQAWSSEHPLLLPALIFHGYAAYYGEQRVVEALGLEHRPPFPQGYPMEPTDPARLDAMRRRKPMYRSVAPPPIRD
jgi:hypothetical protein